jgi:hypothetical protein
LKYLHIILASLLLSSCGIYSFTGISISPDVKSVSIPVFVNNAPLVVPSLSQKLNIQLRNKFINTTNLSLIDNGADLQFSGEITGYTVTPIAAQAGETAALNRLTVTVNVDFVNKKDEKQNYNSTFTKFADFDSNKDLSQVQELLIDDITEQLTEAIFTKAVVNW